MAEPAAPAGKGGPLANLSPRQRRYAVAGGVAAVLALIVVMGRRSSTPPPPVDDSMDASAYDPGAGVVADPGSFGTYADNGAAFGAFTDGVVDSLDDLADDTSQIPNLTKGMNQQAKRLKAMQKRLDRISRRQHGGGGRGGGGGRKNSLSSRDGGGRGPQGGRPVGNKKRST